MSHLHTPNDPFYMTFGKENWNQVNLNNNNGSNKQPAKNTKPKVMFEQDVNIDRPRRSSQMHRKKPTLFNKPHKQNVENTQRTLRRTKAMFSLTDRQPKQLMDVETIRQELQKKYSNDKQTKSSRKFSSMFDNELNKRLKDIETAAKAKILRIRNQNDSRKLDSIYEHEFVLDKYKLINSQGAKKAKMTTVNPTINRYREEMVKLDSLIQRVNAKIGSSTPNHNIDLVKRYTLEKV